MACPEGGASQARFAQELARAWWKHCQRLPIVGPGRLAEAEAKEFGQCGPPKNAGNWGRFCHCWAKGAVHR